MRKLLPLVLLIIPTLVRSQTTNLTIQVTDQGGQSWNNGTWSVLLTGTPGVTPTGPPFFNIGTSVPVPGQTQSGSLSATGSATMTLTQNVGIAPSQSQWLFSVCPQATGSCFTQLAIVTSATTLTIIPPAIVVNASPSPSITAYSDVEVKAGLGQQYYNLTNSVIRLCTVVTAGVCTTFVNIAGGGGGGVPGGLPNQVQINNAGAFGGSQCFNLTTFPNGPANIDCDEYSVGPNPRADLTRWGARFVPVAAQPSAANVTCNSGSPNVTVGTVTGTFLVGDYVMGLNCGAAISVATPAAPTVVSGASQMQTVPDAIVNAYTGGLTYLYRLVTKDSNGGLTLPSPTTTITTGVPLGQQTATVSSVTAVGNTLTILLGSNAPPNKTYFHLSYIAQGGAQPQHKFDGYYNICSGGGTTTITVCNLPFWSVATDATAAEIVWMNGNALSWVNQSGAWTQYVCVERPGDVAFHFLGSAVPASGDGPGFTKFVDWGNTITPESPTGFPEGNDSICSALSVTNDYLDNVKISSCTLSCGTGSTWTLNANAGSSATGSTFVQDSAPSLTAANNTYVNAGVALTIPCTATTAGGPVMNFQSPQALTSIRNWIDQCGNLNVNETIDLGNVVAGQSIPWIGRTQFQLGSNSQNIFFNAYPALNNVGVVNNISFNSNMSASSLAMIENTNVVSNGNQTPNMDHLQFTASGYSSIGLLCLGIFPFGYITNTTKVQLGPSNAPAFYDSTWTPWLYLDGSAELHFLNSYGFGRGVYLNQTTTAGPAQLDMEQNYVQGSIMPTLGVYGAPGTSLYINSRQWVSDTSPQPMIALSTDPTAPFSVAKLRFRDLAGLVVNTFTGWSPNSTWDEGTSNSPANPILSNVFPDDISNFGKLALQTQGRSDGFNRANGGLGSNWINLLNTMSITGNQVSGSGGGWNAAYFQGTGPIPNSTINPINGGEFCQDSIENFGAQQAGCGVYMTATQNGYVCSITGTTIQLSIPNHFIITPATSYSGGGVGDSVYGQAIATQGANTQITCTVFPINGSPFSITGSDASFNSGYPGIATFGTTAVVDAFAGGTLNPSVVPTQENYYQQPQHYTAITVGNAAPIPGPLAPGYYNSNWSATASICTDVNLKLVTTGCAGGSISGMVAGQVAIAGSASSITSSKPLQGTDANILSSSTVAGGTGNLFCTDSGSGATTSGCPNLSGLTSGQVAIAGSATTVTSSKALQGTDANVMSSGTVSGVAATLCTDANGGATTAGCTGGSISGLTTGQIPVAGSATSLTSSKPQQGTDANILTSGTVSATTPALLCTDANSGATTSNCSVYNTQSAATNTNIGATTMVASAPANTMYEYMWTISLTTAGTSCTSSTTVVLNVIFTDPSAGGSITESLGQITIAAGGNGTVGFVAQGVDNIYAKSGTAVQYSTSGYTPGTGCSINPSYQVTMRLLPIS